MLIISSLVLAARVWYNRVEFCLRYCFTSNFDLPQLIELNSLYCKVFAGDIMDHRTLNSRCGNEVNREQMMSFLHSPKHGDSSLVPSQKVL